jgi:hypothetical protein
MTIKDMLFSALDTPHVTHTPKEVALMLMKRGIYGEETKPAPIYDRLLQKFGDKAPGMPDTNNRQNAIRIVRRWIDDAGVKYEGLDTPYEPSEINAEALSYVHRMRLVKRHFLNARELTLREAQIAERVLLEFNDPYGNDVDLIAQYAVIYELAEREIYKDPTDDIEDFLAFAPWRSPEASDLYRTAYRKDLVSKYPTIQLFSPVATNEEMLELLQGTVAGNKITVDRRLQIPIGGTAQLGLPFFISYRTGNRFLHIDRNVELLKQIHKDPTDMKLCKKGCSWEQQVSRDEKNFAQYMTNKPIIEQSEGDKARRTYKGAIE